MFIILGLIILVAAVVVGVAGVLANHGSGHVLTHRFELFGYHLNGSTGRLFLYGIIVGAVAVFGLSMLLAGARRTSRRGSAARQGLKEARGETATVAEERDNLIDERDASRGKRARVPSNGSPDAANGQPESDTPQRSLLHPLGHGAGASQAATTSPDR
jgi:hypothetical protein